LGSALLVLLTAIFLTLTVSISRLSANSAATNPRTTQNIGAIICAVLAFIFSINLVRLLVEFVTFYLSSKAIVERCHQLLHGTELNERAALLVLFDYQIR